MSKATVFILACCLTVAGGCGPSGSGSDAGLVADGSAEDASAVADAGGDGGGSVDGGAGADANWPADLPHIDDYSGASPERVEALVREALAGLGFGSADEKGPRPEDRVFVGRYYMAWIDQTGFYGKMNGLWRLDGAAGDDLDFVVREPGGRVVSFFVVGENGDGAWPAGYPGAEHVEFPNRTPEPNDNPNCANTDWCNQYALDEAAHFTDPDIPWWSACNVGTPPWTELNEPVEIQNVGGALRLVYEGPLVKEADGDGTWDGDACHEDYLFADGVRRRVYVRLGYELHGDTDYFDRVMQVRNPAGNPPFDGPMSFIGGFVVSRWPNPHASKAINRFVRPEEANVSDATHGITLLAGQWNAHDLPPPGGDEVFAWLGQPVSLSVSNDYVAGGSATLDHVGPSDNDDIGFCLCAVHGGLEMGGGLIHGGISLPIAGGTTSVEARRRLALHGDPSIHIYTYEAETDLLHGTGEAETDGWSASTADHAAGHLAYGPYADNWGALFATAEFRLLVDNNNADNGTVVTLDVYDATSDEILSLRDVTRQEFDQPNAYQSFSVTADLGGRKGHAMETRVYWHDIAYVELDRVVVTTR